jgi:unsaturated rhamnogalacturonyl hydrolase
MTVSPNDTSPASSLTPSRWQLRRAATAVICALMGVATAASGSNNGTPFITGETLGILYNNTSNQNGFEFTVGASPITVTSLGRWVVSGNTGTHTVYLKTVSDGATLGTALVNTSGATAGAFMYAALGTPVALAANTSYYVLSQEIVGGDRWYGSSTALTTTSVATINNAEYFDGTSYHMIGSTGAHSQGPVSFTYTTTTAPFDHAAVLSIMRLVADYDINLFGGNYDAGWVRSVFLMGIMSAYRALGEVKYSDYALHWGTVNRWQLYVGDPRFADNQACVQTYAELYLENQIPQNGVMIAAAEKTFDAMVASPLPGRQEWWWEDALFMAPPAMARVAKGSGKTQYLTLMNNMFWDTKAFLFAPAVGLFWRDANFINSNIFWSRGNGWVLAGVARILEVLPTTDSRHADYEQLFVQLAGKVRTLQSADGFWRSSLLAPNTYPNPESSGTALFTFAIAWGINQGLLDRATYLPTVTKAWNALVTAVNTQGRVGWVQPPAAAPGPASQNDTNDYGAGAFLLAGEQILKL